MAIEDFEWEGDIDGPRPSQARLAVAEAPVTTATAEASRGWFAPVQKSVWLEPVLKLCGMALLLAVLAGIGVVATTYAKPGLKLPQGSRALTDALGTSWLKPTPAPDSAPVVAPSLAPPVPASHVVPTQTLELAAGEPLPPAPEPAPSEGAPPGITPDGKVILNLASADELTKLPGVGAKRAAAIVALRVKLKRFKHPTDLLRVKGIGPRSLQRMLPHLVLDAPVAS